MQFSGSLLRAASVVVLAAALVSTGMTVTATAQDFEPPGSARARRDQGRNPLQLVGRPGPQREDRQDPAALRGENPGVSVVREQADFHPHWDKLTIQAAAGNQPCTIQMQTRWLATFAKPNILLPLDDLLAKGVFNVDGIAQPIMDSRAGYRRQALHDPVGRLLLRADVQQVHGREAAPACRRCRTLTLGPARRLRSRRSSRSCPKASTPRTIWAAKPTPSSPGCRARARSCSTAPRSLSITSVAAGVVRLLGERCARTASPTSAEEWSPTTARLIEESNIANGRTFITNRPPNRLDSMQAVIDKVKPGQQARHHALPDRRGRHHRHGPRRQRHRHRLDLPGRTCIPASVAWINFFTQDPRAAADLPVRQWRGRRRHARRGPGRDPSTAPGQVRYIELFRRSRRRQARGLAGRRLPGGHRTPARAYDAVAFEQLTPEEAADQFLAGLQEQVTNAAK